MQTEMTQAIVKNERAQTPPAALALLTDAELEKLWRRCAKRIQETFAGGGTFGIDLPTLYAVAPELAEARAQLKAEARRRWTGDDVPQST